MGERKNYDVIVVGGGILGIAVAWELARGGLCDVLVIDAERSFGAHSTGRSVAYYIPMYESKAYAALSKESIGFLTYPPDGFSPTPLFSRDGAVIAAGIGFGDTVKEEIAAARALRLKVEAISAADIRNLVPAVRIDKIEAAAWYPSAGEIDVQALATAYKRGAEQMGVSFRTSTTYLGAIKNAGAIVAAETSAGRFGCERIVNASGAWAASVAEITGASSVPTLVLRRHLIKTVIGKSTGERWPFFRCPTLPLYFKLNDDALAFSPMDAQADMPRDCPVDTSVVRGAVDTLNAHTTFSVGPDEVSAIAGHRVFGRDHAPLLGRDPQLGGFYWVAGMGGSGIMAAPAVGQIVAGEILGRETNNPDVSYAVDRFARTDTFDRTDQRSR